MKPRLKIIVVCLGLLFGASLFMQFFFPEILSFGWGVTIAVAVACGAIGLGLSLRSTLADLRRRRTKMRPGEEKCPRCGSVQTDRMPDFSNSAPIGVEMTCFNCQETWHTDIDDIRPRLPT